MPPSFEYKGVTYLHTSGKWCTRTNRHTSTAGNSWGWIEGHPGNLCWSNDPGDKLSGSDAAKICEIHNQWVDDQVPVSIKLVRACENLARAERDRDSAEVRFLEAQETFHKAKAVVEQLEALQQPVTA